MKKLKSILFKLLRGLVIDSIKRALEMAAMELNAEIDDSFENEEERNSIKTGISLLHSKALVEIEERLEKL